MIGGDTNPDNKTTNLHHMGTAPALKDIGLDSFKKVHGISYLNIGTKSQPTRYVTETSDIYTRPASESHVLERAMLEVKKDGDNMKKQMAKPSFALHERHALGQIQNYY